jgi:hypothetical protein
VREGCFVVRRPIADKRDRGEIVNVLEEIGMVGGGGGGTRRGDDGSSAALLSTTNIFAALESRRRSSKSSKKKKDESKEKQPASKSEPENLITEPVQFWAPSQVTVKSWADCDDDDEDYYATTAPPPEEHSPELTHTDPEIRLNQEEVRYSSSLQLPY